jgi:hypothetical protein
MFELSSDSTLEFPEDVQSALNVPPIITLEAGNYEVINNNQYYKIILE